VFLVSIGLAEFALRLEIFGLADRYGRWIRRLARCGAPIAVALALGAMLLLLVICGQ
jgi:hypothetical protein